ncbi:DNA-binding protein (modular protein) [Flavobacterium psychrophilum]|nr:DNA-binding protein (modular protein) [Flavobacterium psychrophilum]
MYYFFQQCSKQSLFCLNLLIFSIKLIHISTMTSVSERIKQLRTENNLTQSELAEKVGLTYVQIGRYEKSKSNPSSDVLQKLAFTLGTSTDYLMNGKTGQVEAQLTDKELIKQFQEVEKLNPDEKHLVKTFLDAFITKKKIQQLAM